MAGHTRASLVQTSQDYTVGRASIRRRGVDEEGEDMREMAIDIAKSRSGRRISMLETEVAALLSLRYEGREGKR